MQRVNHLEKALSPLLGRRRRDQIRHEIGSALLQHARDLAGGIAVDGTGGRIGRARAHLPEPQCIAVCDAIVAGGLLEPDRVVGCDRVEICGRHVAMLAQLAFVPTVPLDPLSRLGLSGSGTYEFHNLGHAAGTAQIDRGDQRGAARGDVSMRVNQAGRCSPAMQVDDACLGPSEGHDGRIAPYLEHLAVTHRHRLGDGVFGVDGQHGAMREDQVRCARGLRCGRSGECAAEQTAGCHRL